METTRHFTATVYVVHDGATLLHDHKRLDKWLPPGGHIDRDELPHEAAVREVREETGLDVDLLSEPGDVASESARELPEPDHLLLADVNVTEAGVGHQHVDFCYYAEAPHREVTPGDGEVAAADWEWFTADELGAADFDEDVVEIGRRAIAAVASR